MPDKPHTAVLTIQTKRPGGNATVVDWWHYFLGEWGHKATTVMAGFDPRPMSRWERFRWVVRHWHPYMPPEEPHPTKAVATLPLPLWLFYLTPQLVLGPLLNQFHSVVYGAGPVIGALPLALRRMPTLLWMATLYEDEIEGKVLAGDSWSTRLRASWYWPLIVQQERFILRRADRIIAMSPHTLARVRAVVPEAEERTACVLIPTQAAEAPPPPLIAEPYILNVSRVNDPRKNIPMLLRAFARLNYQAYRLVLTGDTPQPALLALVEGLGISDRVFFMGRVSKEELIALFAHARLFVLSSTQEGLGIALLEAMSYGVPVVTTRCGGPEGIVQDGFNGLMIPNRDDDALVAAMRRVLDDADYHAMLSANAKNYIVENASPEVVGRQLRTHYEAVYGRAK